MAAYALLRKGRKVLFVYRSNTDWMNRYYGLPSGKVENNESASLCAVREAKEEVGVKIKEADLKPLLTMHRFDKDSHVKEWVDVLFEATTWEGEPYNAEPAVHSKIEWLDIDDLPENVIGSVKAAIEAAEKGEIFIQYGWN